MSTASDDLEYLLYYLIRLRSLKIFGTPTTREDQKEQPTKETSDDSDSSGSYIPLDAQSTSCIPWENRSEDRTVYVSKLQLSVGNGERIEKYAEYSQPFFEKIKNPQFESDEKRLSVQQLTEKFSRDSGRRIRETEKTKELRIDFEFKSGWFYRPLFPQTGRVDIEPETPSVCLPKAIEYGWFFDSERKRLSLATPLSSLMRSKYSVEEDFSRVLSELSYLLPVCGVERVEEEKEKNETRKISHPINLV